MEFVRKREPKYEKVPQVEADHNDVHVQESSEKNVCLVFMILAAIAGTLYFTFYDFNTPPKNLRRKKVKTSFQIKLTSATEGRRSSLRLIPNFWQVVKSAAQRCVRAQFCAAAPKIKKQQSFVLMECSNLCYSSLFAQVFCENLY